MARLIILGAGGHVHSIAEMVLQQNEYVLACSLMMPIPASCRFGAFRCSASLLALLNCAVWLTRPLWQLAATLFGIVCLRT